MSHTIRYPASNFDDAANFAVFNPRTPAIPMNCYLFCAAWHGEHTGDNFYGQNPDKDNSKVFCMQHAGVLKANYTDADRESRSQFAAMQPIKHGDIVNIEGHGEYRFVLLGNFSDAGRFERVEAA